MNNLRASVILNDAYLKLIAIEALYRHHDKTEFGYQFAVSIEPIAVIVCHRRGVYAIDMSARPMVLDQLMHDVPGLDAMIDAFCGSVR